MKTEKAHPLLTLLQELESMKKRKRNMLESMKKRKRNMLEAEGSSSLSSVFNTKITPTREPHESETRDLLSNLPDSLIHDIFSFLHFNHSPRFAVLSKRFRDLSITSPTLRFRVNHHENRCSRDHPTCSSCISFLSYITNLLHQRQSSPIRNLSFLCNTIDSHSCNQHLEAHQQWIHHVITSFHLEELCLILSMGSMVCCDSIDSSHSQWLFPVFNPQSSLKSLTISMNAGTLKLPKEFTLPSLQTLSMARLSVDSSEPIGEWVCRSFPNLKRLNLRRLTHRNISGDMCLNIQSTCIEDLTVDDAGFFTSVKVYAGNLSSFDFRTPFMSLLNNGDYKMEIFTPNLQTLRWEGDARRLRWEGEMPGENLQDACFMFPHYDTCSPGKKDFVNILRGVRCARRLCIDSRILEFPLEDPSNLFGNLRHLCLTIGFRKEDGKYIFPLLQRAPNLEYLVIKEEYETKTSSENSLFNFLHDLEDDDKVLPVIIESSLNSDGVKLMSIGGLKKVEIKISKFNKEIILLIGMVMKICNDLEKMTIRYPDYCEKWMTQLGVQDAIQRFDRASSSLQLCLLPTDYRAPSTFHGPCGRKDF